MIRKTTLLLLSLFLFQGVLLSQKTELSANLNSGFYRFSGEDYPTVIITLSPEPDLFPYGSPGQNSGFSYELSLQAQRITRKNIIFGLELAYQSLESKRKISGMTPSSYTSVMYVADGNARIAGSFVDMAPFAGYRFTHNQITIDLKLGPEYALCIDRKQKIHAKFDTGADDIKTERSLDNKRADFRIRGQATISYKRFGINAGYAHGLTNYYKNDIIGHPEYYSRFVRLGVSYRII